MSTNEENKEVPPTDGEESKHELDHNENPETDEQQHEDGGEEGDEMPPDVQQDYEDGKGKQNKREDRAYVKKVGPNKRDTIKIC